MRQKNRTYARVKMTGLVAAMLLSPAIQADVTLTMRDSRGANDSVIQIKGDMARMSQHGQSGYMLYDKASDTVIHVDEAQKEYMQIDRATLERYAASMSAMRAQMAPQIAMMREQLKNMPPEQRAMMEQRMGGMLSMDADAEPVDVKLNKRGSRKVSGFECDEYQVLNNNQPVAEVCLAVQAGAGMSKADFATLEAMMGFMRDMAGKAQKLAAGMVSGAPQFEFGDARGVPVAMKNLKQGREFTIADVSGDTLDGSLFNAYKGYRKRDMPRMQ